LFAGTALLVLNVVVFLLWFRVYHGTLRSLFTA